VVRDRLSRHLGDGETMTEQLYDVVIFEIATKKVTSIVGVGMQLDEGHYNAQKRIETVLPRLNDNFDVSAVPAGKYNVGDVIAEVDL